MDARDVCFDTFRVASRHGLRTAVEVSSVGQAASMFAVGSRVLFQGQSAKGFPDCGEALRVYATFLCQSLCFNGRHTLECMRVAAYDALQGAWERFGGGSAAMATDWADDCDQCHGLKGKPSAPFMATRRSRSLSLTPFGSATVQTMGILSTVSVSLNEA